MILNNAEDLNDARPPGGDPQRGVSPADERHPVPIRNWPRLFLRGWMGWMRRIHAIVHGERAITAETALLLSRFFGNSAGFWMGLQTQYDLELAEDHLAERLDSVTAHSSK